MKELIKIELNKNQEPIVSGRELHKELEVKTPYTQWFDRMKEYGFTEKSDYVAVSQKCEIANGGYQEKIDHAIKLDMAKEIAMIQRNEKGKEVRQYFIQVEKDFNSPEKVMARALMLADKQIKTLQIQNEQQNQLIEEQKPKVLFANSVETAKNSVLLKELAIMLKQNGVDIGQNRLFEILREKGYLNKQKGESWNLPTQKAMNLGLFEIKKITITKPTGEIFTKATPKVTGKGQIYFIDKFLKEQSIGGI